MKKITPFTILSSLIIFVLACYSENNPTIIMETSLGTITLELFPKKAPTTVKNFLSYPLLFYILFIQKLKLL